MSEGCVLGFLGLIVAASWVLTSICLAVHDATADHDYPGTAWIVVAYMAVTLPMAVACGMALYLK
jgi:hypothetical protein